MTISISQLLLYCGALVVLFLTPGPVWVAIIARTVSGGLKSGFSLVLGVSLGDLLWPIIVYFGLGVLTFLYSDILLFIRYIAAVILIIMGSQVLRNYKKDIKNNNNLTKKGFWAGFSAGLIAVIANPKASLFYLTLLPGFFNFGTVGIWDILIISVVSFLIPMTGNVIMIMSIVRARSFLSSEKAIQNTNIISGTLLILVGIIIAFT
jgi:threonine/homoserine/homoserine lactone efflux protein